MTVPLTRDGLLDLARKPLAPEPVDTPHGTVHVPRLTGAGLSKFLDEIDGKPKGVELSHMIVDQYGTRLFTDAQAGELDGLPATFTVPVTKTFQEVNGLRPKDSAGSGGSPTGSP